MTHKEEMSARNLAGEFIAAKIKNKVSRKYKQDTKTTRKLNMAGDAAKDFIKSGVKALPNFVTKNK